MYALHKSNEKEEEFTTEESLSSIFQRKISKLVSQLKLQKILHPEYDVDLIIDELLKFKEGETGYSIGNITYYIQKNEGDLYISKEFKDYPRYRTKRYYSEKQDEKYDRIKDEMFSEF